MPFISMACNRGRWDITCDFGCRDIRKKAKDRENSKTYYKTENGHLNKQAINRARYDNSIPVTVPGHKRTPIIDPWHSYIQLFLLAILEEKVSIQEILTWELNSRSVGLDSS